MKLLFSIPAKNEEKNIGYVLEHLPKKLPGISKINILVVDDGSTDETSKIAEKYGAAVLRHKHNRGVGGAFKTAVAFALDKKYDVVVTMDADGQFQAKDIPRIVQPILDHEADFVTGTRFAKGYKHESWIKHHGNMMVNWLVNTLTGLAVTDASCGFRAYSREALLRLQVMGEFTYTHEALIDLAHKNVSIKEVPIDVKPRRHGRSRVARNVLLYGARALKIMMRSFRDYKPLKFFGLPGFVVFLLGGITLLGSFIYYLINLRTTPIRTYLFVGSVMLLFGFLVMILAIVADMLDRHRNLQEEILYHLRKK